MKGAQSFPLGTCEGPRQSERQVSPCPNLLGTTLYEMVCAEKALTGTYLQRFMVWSFPNPWQASLARS